MLSEIRTIYDHKFEKTTPFGREPIAWMAAEIHATSAWFIVEFCASVQEQPIVERWVTTSIHIASDILRRKGKGWKRVLVCTTPSEPDAPTAIFESVITVHQSECGDFYVFKLATGRTLLVGTNVTPNMPPISQELRHVFSEEMLNAKK